MCEPLKKTAKRFVDVHIMDTAKDKMSLNFFAARSTQIYIRYITINKMMIKNQEELPLLVKLSRDVPAAKDTWY